MDIFRVRGHIIVISSGIWQKPLKIVSVGLDWRRERLPDDSPERVRHNVRDHVLPGTPYLTSHRLNRMPEGIVKVTGSEMEGVVETGARPDAVAGDASGIAEAVVV